MDVKFKVPLTDQLSIEFGIATWTKDAPVDEQEWSVRRRYNGETGRFSPRGSSEVPINDMPMMMIECMKRDYIPTSQLLKILNEVSLSLTRQLEI